MSGQIFISYRREDSAPWARLAYQSLSQRFPQSRIFMDVDNLPPGIDFVEAIEKSVGACDVQLVVIGKRWLMARDDKRRRRLDNPEDFVRLEIATALKRGIRVIPVLVDGASMPRAGELPEDLKSLTRRQALAVSHDRFRADAERLVGAVERALEDTRVELQRKHEERERVNAEQREPEAKGRLEAERRQKEVQDRLEVERRESARQQAEVEQREIECRQEAQAHLEAEGHQKETEAFEGKNVGLSDPPKVEDSSKEDHTTPESPAVSGEATGASLATEQADSLGRPLKANQLLSKKTLVNLKKRWRLLVVMGIGAAVCLLGFGLFKAIRSPPVSIRGSSSPTSAPLAIAPNSPSLVPTAGPASPSPRPSGAERLATAASSVPIPIAAPSGSPVLPIQRDSTTVIRKSASLLTQPSVSLLGTPTPAPSTSPSPMPAVSQPLANPSPSGTE